MHVKLHIGCILFCILFAYLAYCPICEFCRFIAYGWLVSFFFSSSGVFDEGDASGDSTHLEHPLQGFLPARNVWSLNPWHFDSQFPAAKCVCELVNKLSGERNSSVDTLVRPSPEFALVDKCPKLQPAGSSGHDPCTVQFSTSMLA